MPWASKEKRAEYQRRYRAAKKAIDPDFENRRARAYRAADPKAHTEASMKWARNNPEKVREIARRTYQRRKETVKARTKAYANSPQGKARAKERAKSPEFKAKKNAYLRERRASDPAYKALYYFRIRFRQWIKGNKGVSVRDLVGCSREELKAHLERQFAKGMNWENWSTNGWHVDHIRPISSFDLSNPEEVKAAWHFTNLQPLWAAANRQKHKRLALLC